MTTKTTDPNAQFEALFPLLTKMYPNAKMALVYKTTWELLVSVILSAQCTDVMVNKVTSRLFQKYTTLDDYVHADRIKFENDIKSTGFYHNKAKNILASALIIKEKFGGIVPKTMEEILILPGVARKTANVVLGEAYGVSEGIAVDTHVARISQRLRLVELKKVGGKKLMVFEYGKKHIIDYIRDADPVKIELELIKVVPKSEWITFTHTIIHHGRALCKAQNPDCLHCPLNRMCPASRV